MDWLQLIFLSLIQGLTEFLPISSSAHLILPAQLFDWPDQGLAFDVGVHFGTLVAVLAYFRQELWSMTRDTVSYPWHRQYNESTDLALKLLLATVPVVVIGALGKNFIEAHLRTVPVIAWSTLLFAAALWFADRQPGMRTHPHWRDAWIIGCAQVLALVPGTSRSGITITAALLVGLSRTDAARFSFLLAIPTIAGAQLLLTLDWLTHDTATPWRDLLAGALIAGVAAYLCIHAFIELVERTGMLPYVLYRIVLGCVLLGVYYL